jgi:hypothetical protein
LRIWIASCLLLAVLACGSEQGPRRSATNTAAAKAKVPAAGSSEAGACELTGESTDTDPRGLRVHAEPNMDSRELGRLYPGIDPETFFHDDDATQAEGLVGAQFTVDRVADDWLHIDQIDPVTDGVDAGGEPTLNFRGSGWVHASRVRLLFTTVAAHQRPDADSPIVADARFSNGYDARYLLDCRGRWAKLEYAPLAGPRRPRIEAWLLSQSNREHAEVMRRSLHRGDAAR